MSNTKTKFTPGPWTFGRQNDAYGMQGQLAVISGMHGVAEVYKAGADATANAALIAAAPDMHHALESILDTLQAWRDTSQLQLENCEPRLESKFNHEIANYDQLIKIGTYALSRAKGSK